MLHQSGSSFIEVIISMLLLSIILLGLDAMQIIALREAKTSYYFSVASQQLRNVSERLASTNMSEVDEQMSIWNAQNKEVLPQGRGIVSGYYPNLKVTIFWGGFSEQSCQTNRIDQSGCLHLEQF